MTDRCEPLPELQASEGWHWLQRQFATYPVRWTGREWDMGLRHVEDAYERGWRYLAPVATPAEVEALRAERDRLEATALNAAGQVDNLRAIAAASQAELTTLRARVARLQEALKPFAAAGLWDWNVTVWRGVPSEQAQILYHDGTKESITLADLHAARAALSAETP